MTGIPAIGPQILRDVTGVAREVPLRHLNSRTRRHTTEEDAKCKMHQVDFEMR